MEILRCAIGELWWMRISYVDGGMTAPWLVSKYAQALATSPGEVEILYLRPKPKEAVEGLFDGTVPVRRFGIPGRLQRVKQPIANMRLLRYLVKSKTDCCVASDPFSLRICGLLRKHLKFRLVYTPWEYYPCLSYGTQADKDEWAALERKYIPLAAAVVLLGDKLAEEYRRIFTDLNGRFHVVYSGWPDAQAVPRSALREKLGLRADQRIVLYQGIISRKRGLGKVLEALTRLPENVVFVMLGYGSDTEYLRGSIKTFGLSRRVFITPAVPQNELMAYTAGADIGIIPIPNLCRSYYLCNPGKLFEFIAAGLPLAVSNLAQLEWYVKSRGLGEVFDPESPEDIARALRKLLENDDYRAQCAARSRQVQLTEASWEIQSEKLRRIVFGE